MLAFDDGLHDRRNKARKFAQDSTGQEVQYNASCQQLTDCLQAGLEVSSIGGCSVDEVDHTQL